jgi:hypothetical protein
MKIPSQNWGKLNTTRQETAANPTHEKSMTEFIETDKCTFILSVRGMARLEFGKGGERLLEYRQSLPMSEEVEWVGTSLPLGLVLDVAASKAASA